MIVELKTWEVTCEKCPTTVKVVAAQFELPAGWTQGTERAMGGDEAPCTVELCPTCTAAQTKGKPRQQTGAADERTWGAPWPGADFTGNVAL